MRNGKFAISFWQPGGYGIWVLNSDGSHRRRLLAGDQPEWSPNGHELAFVHRSPAITYQLMIADSDGRRVRAVETGLGAIFGLTWSPDEQQIAYGLEHGDSNEIDVIRLRDGTTEDLGKGSEPAWSPDGHTLAVRSGGATIELIDIATGARTFVARPGAHPEWSPDGRSLGYTRGATQQLQGEHLMLWSKATDRIRPLAHNRDGYSQPAWSPYGRWIAFAQVAQQTASSYGIALYTINAAGGQPRRLTGVLTRDSGFPTLDWQAVH